MTSHIGNRRIKRERKNRVHTEREIEREKINVRF